MNKATISIIITLACIVGSGLFGYGKLQAQVEDNKEDIACQYARVEDKLDKIYDYMIKQ